MFLADVILGQGVRILIDTGATHNVNDINFARIMGIMERRINTTIIIGSGTKITCRSASYNVPYASTTRHSTSTPCLWTPATMLMSSSAHHGWLTSSTSFGISHL